MRQFVSKITIYGAIATGILGLCALSIAMSWPASFKEIRTSTQGSEKIFLASNGEPIHVLRTQFDKRREHWRSLDIFPPSLVRTLIAGEDRRFYSHYGVDPFGLARALQQKFKGGAIQGASTLTMQLTDLIDTAVLNKGERIRKRSLLQKIRQIWRAVLLDLTWNKNEILEAYLNLIHLRGEHQGVPSFVGTYLKTSTSTLTDAESAAIVALIASPNQKTTSLRKRACILFTRISPSNSCALVDSVVDRMENRNIHTLETPELAPHLARRLSEIEPAAGIQQTFLNYHFQSKVQEVLERHISGLSHKNVRDGAALVIENSTGNVVAYVGSVRSSKSPHVDGVRAARQAGSTLKPFLYGAAIDRKTLTAASVLLDEPTAIQWSGGTYRPTNYDKTFHGPVSVREALASSLNVPAVKVVTILGLQDSYQVLKNFKFSGLKEADYYGVSLALGAVEVRLDDLTNAYRALARGGEWSPLKLSTSQAYESENLQVLSPQASFITGSILADPLARSMGFGTTSVLETDFWTAVKTGTSKDYRDNWCIGFSDKFTVGIWVGNFDASAMEKVSGVSGAGPIWLELMNELHRIDKSSPPTRPENIVAKQIRHSWASRERSEVFIRGTEPLHTQIEPHVSKEIQFMFPSQGSTLVLDPKLDENQIALFARFKGQIPIGSELRLNGKKLGEAVSPFKIERLRPGRYTLEIIPPQESPLSNSSAKVQFDVKGIAR